MTRRLLRTHAVRAVAQALLDAPDQPHWGAELCEATGERSSVVHPILGRLVDAGLLTDEGWAPSDVGGSSRHVYRVNPDRLDDLRALLAGQFRGRHNRFRASESALRLPQRPQQAHPLVPGTPQPHSGALRAAEPVRAVPRHRPAAAP